MRSRIANRHVKAGLVKLALTHSLAFIRADIYYYHYQKRLSGAMSSYGNIQLDRLLHKSNRIESNG